MTEPLRPISVIGASAGTGKTYRLASDFASSLRSNALLSPTEIIATTFTNKAADELIQRIRRTLLNDGSWSQAQAVNAALIGTVNSICGRLVSNLAIDAGLSPSVRVIPEERQVDVFQLAVEQVTSAYDADLWRVIYRLGMEDDWRADVNLIADAARQNNIPPDDLESRAAASWASLNALLPPALPESSGSTYLRRLADELESTITSLPAAGDETRTTVDQKTALENIQHNWQSMGEIPWHAIVKMSKVKPGKRSAELVETLKELAGEHFLLPAFRHDMERFISTAFSCAADCLRAYSDFKAARGLLDFIDQEQLALSLLRSPSVLSALQGKYSTLFVDEFQDTSPIQLAVFLEIGRIVTSSTWVGDEKQSIFGFRGADPILMQDVVETLVPETGGTRDNLSRSYRSRPSLIALVNHVFVPALAPLGIAPDNIEIRHTARTEDPRMSSSLHLWWLAGGSQQAAARSLAQGVRKILESPNDWRVGVAKDEPPRAIRGSDIAILCRSNRDRIRVADALSELGIIVSTERSGLLNTPECVLCAAVLRYLADAYDTLSMAEIVRFTDTGNNPQLWLQEWLDGDNEQVRSRNSILGELDSLRSQLIGLTPKECVQLATTAPSVVDTILKWGNQRQRLLNLEALIGIAQQYEEHCATDRSAATVAGLVTYLESDCPDAKQPANPDEEAVQVLTYHKAKGLEWPLVIMNDLDAPPAASPFGVHVPRNRDRFDARSPLANRTVRYWPWPYGQQRKDVELVECVSASEQMAEVSREREAENLRLLYVGMTRPRDYLVLACRNASAGAAWLHMARGSDGESLFQVDETSVGAHPIVRGASEVTAVYSVVSTTGDQFSSTLDFTSQRFVLDSDTSTVPTDLSYSCVASGLRLSPTNEGESVTIQQRMTLGPRLPLSGVADMRALGDALHLFLAVDDPTRIASDRLEIAQRIANSFAVTALSSADFIKASTRLRAKLDELYPDAAWLTEWPVTGRHGPQRIQGAIDLLLELSEGLVIVDHKSFPGGTESWESRAISHYPQLEAYKSLVEQATFKPVIAMFVHMPLLGLLLSFQVSGQWSSQQLPYEEDATWLTL